MRFVILMLSLLVFTVIAAGPAWAGRFVDRQIRQQERIHQGIRNGTLTRGEIRHLQRQQYHIRQDRRRAWADGRLTRRERWHLESRLDRTSRRIHHLKHNGRSRW